MRNSVFIIFLISALSLSACGIKGPLYLPEDAAPKPPVVQPATPPTPTSK